MLSQFFSIIFPHFVELLREHATITFTQTQMQTDVRTRLFSLVQTNKTVSTPRLHYHMYDVNLRKQFDVSQKCHVCV